MSDLKKNEEAQRFLQSRGYTEEEIRRWLKGPPAQEAPREPKRPSRAPGTAREPTAGPAPPGNEGGVDVREVEHWIAALQHEDVPAELRAVYLRNLQAAIEAAKTPGVTPEDVAYWLHRLRDPRLSPRLRAAYKRNVREALRRYNLTSEGGTP